MIEVKDIEKLAALSRIKLSPAEKEQMRKEIVSIVAYVDQLQQVSSNAAGTVDFATDSSATGGKTKRQSVRNVLREDTEPHESGIYTEAILANAPRRQKNYLKVKKIL